MSTADTIPDPGHRARTLKDSPFQSLEEFLETVSWRVEHEARKIAGRRTPHDREDLVSEATLVLMKEFNKARGKDLHKVTGGWVHVVARRAMLEYVGKQSILPEHIWADLSKFRKLKARIEQTLGAEVSNEEALALSDWSPAYQKNIRAALKVRVSGDLEASEEMLKIADPFSEQDPDRDLFGEKVPELIKRIQYLPKIQREVVTAYYLEGKSLKEIAAARGRTPAAVSFQKTAGFRALVQHFLRKPKPQKVQIIDTPMKLINMSTVRRYALDVLKQERPGLSDKFTRVGSEFFDAIEAATRAAVANRIKNHNSSGKTLR